MKYARIHSERFSAVLWVNGANESTLHASFSRLGRIVSAKLPKTISDYWNTASTSKSPRETASRSNLNLSRMNVKSDKPRNHNGSDDTTEMTAKDSYDFMLSWLHDSLYDWLLIADNLDDPHMISRLEDLMSHFWNGTVLITSRSWECEKLGNAIEVAEMSMTDAVRLLRRRAQLASQLSEDQEQAAISLVSRLGYLALAVDQASAYIRSNRLSVGEYNLLFDEEESYLLRKSAKFRYHKTRSEDSGTSVAIRDRLSDTVLTTWEISFRYIEEIFKEASLLLTLFAFLDYEDIPESLFDNIYKTARPWYRWTSSGNKEAFDSFGEESGKALIEFLNSEINFRDAMQQLISLSLVRRKVESRSLSIHPVGYQMTNRSDD